MRLELSENLERILSSTNLIENLFNGMREIGSRVKRWQGGIMLLDHAGVIEPTAACANSPAIVRYPPGSPCCALTMPNSTARKET
jgi:hypothetical protein